MRNRALAVGIIGLALWACEAPEQLLGPATIGLRFDTDTLFFDTLLTEQPSPVRFVHVHNPNDNAVEARAPSLVQAASSPFVVHVKGKPAEALSTIRILGNDSVLLTISTRLFSQAQQKPYELEDRLRVVVGEQAYTLVLHVWAQDATQHSDTLRITTNTTWEDRVGFLFDVGVVVEEGVTLRIQPGMRLFFQPGAGMEVRGQLLAMGDQDAPIMWSPARQDGSFRDAAGRWKGISFGANSVDNSIAHAYIRGPELAIRLGALSTLSEASPSLQLRSVRISDASRGGIAAYNAQLKAENVLIYHASDFLLLHYGGDYVYTHCSALNFPYDFIGRSRSFQFYNEHPLHSDGLPLSVRIENSIFWGRLAEEFSSTSEGVVQVQASVLRTELPSFAPNNQLVHDITALGFVAAFENNYQLEETSVAVDIGSPTTIAQDIQGELRDERPDAGAFEYVATEKATALPTQPKRAP